MKKRIVTILLVCTLSFLLLLSGCLPKALFQPKPNENTETADNTAGDNSSDDPRDDEDNGEDNNEEPDGDSATPSDDSGEAVDCNWTLYVDQTIPVEKDGLTVNYTLLLIAQKAGGKDVNGTYQGAAYLGVNFDASQMSNEVLNVLGGFNVNAYSYDLTFDVVGFDKDAYDDYGVKEGDIPLASLVIYESMALISPEMEGTGVLNPSVEGVQGEHAEVNESVSSTAPIPMKITVNSGKVDVSIPSLNISYSFKGNLTGEPLQGGEQGDPLEQAIDEIEAILEEKEAEASSAGGGGLDDILGQFGGN